MITGLLCLKHWLYEVLHRIDFLPPWVADIFISESSFGLIGLIAGLALVIEDQRRHAELVMYILPKAMESAWRIAGGSGHFRKVTNLNGEVVVGTYQPLPSVDLDLSETDGCCGDGYDYGVFLSPTRLVSTLILVAESVPMRPTAYV